MNEGDQRIPGLGGQLIEARQELARLQRQLQEMGSSKSWRITAPLRSFVALLRGERPVPSPLDSIGAEPDGRIPHELWNLGIPSHQGCSGVSFVDCTPYLAGLFADNVIQSFLEEDRAPTREWNFTGDKSPSVGLISGTCLARDLAFEAPVLRLFPEDAVSALRARPPEFLLIDTGLHEKQSPWWLELRNDDSAILNAIRSECASARIPVVVWLRTDLVEYPRFRHLVGGAARVYAVGEDIHRLALEDAPRQVVSLMTPKFQPAIHNPVRTTPIVLLRSRLPATVLRDVSDNDAGSTRPSSVRSAEPDGGEGRLVWEFPSGTHASGEDGSGSSRVMLGGVRCEDRLVLSKLVDAVGVAVHKGDPVWKKQQDMVEALACGLPVDADEEVARSGFASQWAELLAGKATPRARQQPFEFAVWRRRALDRVAEGHRTANALATLRSDLGFSSLPARVVSCLMATKRPARLMDAVEMFRRQTYPHRELIIVVHGSDTLPKIEVDGCRVVTLSAPLSMGLGDCLNIAAAHASGQYWAKLDDDDYYSEKYLARMVGLLDMARADVGGMPLLFTHFMSDDSVYWDPARLEFAFQVRDGAWRSGEICGATLAGRMDVLKRVPFRSSLRRGIDSAFLDDCAYDGARIVVGDGFGYLCRRSADGREHTWVGDEEGIRSRGVRVDGDIESRLAVVDG